ncbi:MAG: LuxR family transcriptional regulator, partial [Actinobacteria bacterium]|nr:LuxR family transcriptional regulator [Actinomycetota bacterium]
TLLNFYNTIFPFVATALFLLPIIGSGWAASISAFVYFAFFIISSLMMVSGIQIARETRVDTLFAFGIFAGSSYLLLDIGTIVGIRQFMQNDYGQLNLALIALFSIYVLSLTLGVIHNKRFSDDEEETATETDKESAASLVGQTPLADVLSEQCEILAEKYGLSSREAEIMKLVTRGRDVPYIAKQLNISENTVRYHSKNLYYKVNVHNKQDLVSLVEGIGSAESHFVGD